jgi:amino acid transporter
MFKLAGSVGLALAVANLKRRIRNLAVRSMLGAIGVAVAIIALCFFLVTAHLSLSLWVGPIGSSAIIGGVLLVVALVLFFLASRPMREQARAVEQPAAHLTDALGGSFARISQMLGSRRSPLLSPVFLSAGLALVAGLFLGRRTTGHEPRD